MESMTPSSSSSSPSLSPGPFLNNCCAQKRRRKVHFGSSETIEFTRASSQQRGELWWSRDDFDSIMWKALDTATETKRHVLLTEAIDQATQFAQKIASLLCDQNDLYECLQKLDDEGRGLRMWCQYGHSRRGIEKYTSRFYHESRKNETRKVVTDVMALSRNGATPESIGLASEQSSRASVLLARMYGIADAKAAASHQPTAVKTNRLEQPDLPKPQRSLLAQHSVWRCRGQEIF